MCLRRLLQTERPGGEKKRSHAAVQVYKAVNQYVRRRSPDCLMRTALAMARLPHKAAAGARPRAPACSQRRSPRPSCRRHPPRRCRRRRCRGCGRTRRSRARLPRAAASCRSCAAGRRLRRTRAAQRCTGGGRTCGRERGSGGSGLRNGVDGAGVEGAAVGHKQGRGGCRT